MTAQRPARLPRFGATLALMSQQNMPRAPRISLGPGEIMVFGLIIVFIGGMIMTDDGAFGAIIIAIGATMTQVGIIATAVEWAIKRTREN